MAEFDVFLSHNSEDKPTIRRLGNALKKRGITVWLDEWELRPGDDWMDALEEIVTSCKSAAVCVGENGVGPWQDPEMKGLLRRFVQEKKSGASTPVIPVLLPKAPAAIELPMFLNAFMWVDLRDGLRKKGLDQLEWGITGIDPADRSAANSGSPVAVEQQDKSERFKELTTQARRRIADEATKWLKKECDPFVMPALARRVNRPEAMTSRHETDPWEEVSDNESRALVLGQLPENQNRVRIFSQSGTGKTTLLHYSEHQIAEADAGLVPVRVSALSSYDWRGDVPVALVNRVLHPFLPSDTDEATRVGWLRNLIREHRVVFLCDAVDQTDDQLAGFGQFLQSVDVCDCPAILTGRPEVEQTRSGVFDEATWDTLRVESFDEQRIRDYLGDVSDRLLPVEGEEWQDRKSWERKQHWPDLLKVPLLLKLMKRLAADDGGKSSRAALTDLHSRHAIYREAVRHLVEQGWAGLRRTPHREALLDLKEVNEHLSEMAWNMASQDNFTTVFRGDTYRRWLLKNKDAARALAQVDLTTRYSLLDNPGEYGLAWRHLSFCEYFAGVHLAEQDREEQESVVREHARKPSWQWVFRFALSELEAEGHQNGCAALARDLIRFGNPFLVFDAINGDTLKLPEKLDTACRWLVHRDWGEKDYRDAWESDRESPDVDNNLLNILQTLFDRRYRDSRCLHPAWELLQSSSDPQTAEIRNKFLAEFGELAAGSGATRTAARSLSVVEHFRQCPPAGKEGQSFQIGEDAERSVKIEPFYLGKAPVTNLQFELFDPSHEHWRNQYSPNNDSPALYVSWYMVVMFCTWLGEGRRLPTEEEWEVACRAGTTTQYWWGDEFDVSKCNAEGNMGRATAANPDHANDWGLMEMCGNVGEWCQDETEYGRVLRGGSWFNYAVVCRCSSRDDYWQPGSRNFLVGFRLARTNH